MVDHISVAVVDTQTITISLLKKLKNSNILVSFGPMHNLLHGRNFGDHVIQCLRLPGIALFDTLECKIWLSGYSIIEYSTGVHRASRPKCQREAYMRINWILCGSEK